MEKQYCVSPAVLVILLLATVVPSCSSSTGSRHFHFNVQWKNISRLCSRKEILTVNGEYPGPTIAVNEGENVEIRVTNGVSINTTIHW
ncbi:unnamed protein product [Lactuca virosa]|uniref:Plastocyanin-like domain-containing protein n=1 Tax=Lactuca virosa TaxID=75947 RepID=A0AAU9NMT7_9ASTR|nr:unnamed protein product [Lactuca virosa]